MKIELKYITGEGKCIVISDLSIRRLQEVFLALKTLILGEERSENKLLSISAVNKIADEIRLCRKIPAIKFIRAETGWGLKEAKEYIDKYAPQGYSETNTGIELAVNRFTREHLPEDFINSEEMEI